MYIMPREQPTPRGKATVTHMSRVEQSSSVAATSMPAPVGGARAAALPDPHISIVYESRLGLPHDLRPLPGPATPLQLPLPPWALSQDMGETSSFCHQESPDAAESDPPPPLLRTSVSSRTNSTSPALNLAGPACQHPS